MHQSLFYIYGVDTDCDHDHMLLQYNECNKMTFLFPLLWKQVSLIPGLYLSIVSSNIILPLLSPQKQVQVQEQVKVQVQVQVQVQVLVLVIVLDNNYNHINCDYANSIHMIPYCICGVDTDKENGCGMDNEDLY